MRLESHGGALLGKENEKMKVKAQCREKPKGVSDKLGGGGRQAGRKVRVWNYYYNIPVLVRTCLLLLLLLLILSLRAPATQTQASPQMIITQVFPASNASHESHHSSCEMCIMPLQM